MFYEIVVAPKYSEKGLQVLTGKSKTLRILEAKKQEKGKHSLRQVGGGWLLQEADDISPDGIDFTTVTQKKFQQNNKLKMLNLRGYVLNMSKAMQLLLPRYLKLKA